MIDNTINDDKTIVGGVIRTILDGRCRIHRQLGEEAWASRNVMRWSRQ